MDKTFEIRPANFIVVTGLGLEISSPAADFLTGKHPVISERDLFHDPDPREFLVRPKTLKFMSKQDRLALVAAGKALRGSGIDPESLKTSCGLFMAVGYIPFRREEAEMISAHAQEDGQFSMDRFTTDAFDRVNPLLAFSCLPNMPGHHVSANFDLQGEYFMTYPGMPEFFLALQEAVGHLQAGDMDFALVGGVADQNNFLVQNHFRKYRPGQPFMDADVSAFLVLERVAQAEKRGKAPLLYLRSLEVCVNLENSVLCKENPTLEMGPAELPARLCLLGRDHQGYFNHAHHAHDHIFKSTWEVV
jgi:3-oxoacyl-(acyl-carrier-protein) synthase